MSRFNLVDESWIPIRFIDGTRCELGIQEVLLRSKEIEAIEDASPLVVAALYRFLLAVLYRALEGPTDIDQAKKLFMNGLPAERIVTYLEKWRARFWLFDEKYPFGQISGYVPKEWRAWTVLAAENNADNAKVLFDHTDVNSPGSIGAEQAVKWLLATHVFSVSCGRSELSHTSTAPSATAMMVIPMGSNIQDTLLFSLVNQNREVSVDDHPIWERPQETIEELKAGIERPEFGIADRYTWRSRTILIKDEDDGRVRWVGFASGVGHSNLNREDPMLCYRIDEKLGKLPLQFRERGVWRDYDSLMPDKDGMAPRVMQNAITLGLLDRKRFPRSVMVLGQMNNKAKIEYWRMEECILPEALERSSSIKSEIRQLLEAAEDAYNNGLRKACRLYARDNLSRGDREPADGDIKQFIRRMPCEAWYWSELETHFYGILRSYGANVDAERIRHQWLIKVRDTLRAAWQKQSSLISEGGIWEIRAGIRAESYVLRKIADLNSEIDKLDPVKENN